jgi:hypothetical protein
MALLKTLFKKKAGGTFVGNLIRSTASKFSGGISDLVLKAPPLNAPSGSTEQIKNQQQLQVVESYAKPLSQSLSKKVLPSINNALGNPSGSVQDVATSLVESSTLTAMQTVKQQLKKYWWVLLIPGGLIIYWIIKKVKNSKSGTRSRRY